MSRKELEILRPCLGSYTQYWTALALEGLQSRCLSGFEPSCALQSQWLG